MKIIKTGSDDFRGVWVPSMLHWKLSAKSLVSLTQTHIYVYCKVSRKYFPQ